MCPYVCICPYAFIHVCPCVCIRIIVFMSMRGCSSVCVYECLFICACLCVCACAPVSSSIRAWVWIHVCLLARVRDCVQPCGHFRECVCPYVSMRGWLLGVSVPVFVHMYLSFVCVLPRAFICAYVRPSVSVRSYLCERLYLCIPTYVLLRLWPRVTHVIRKCDCVRVRLFLSVHKFVYLRVCPCMCVRACVRSFTCVRSCRIMRVRSFVCPYMCFSTARDVDRYAGSCLSVSVYPYVDRYWCWLRIKQWFLPNLLDNSFYSCNLISSWSLTTQIKLMKS